MDAYKYKLGSYEIESLNFDFMIYINSLKNHASTTFLFAHKIGSMCE